MPVFLTQIMIRTLAYTIKGSSTAVLVFESINDRLIVQMAQNVFKFITMCIDIAKSKKP